MHVEPVSPPIIITCKLQGEATTYFNDLRQQHYPSATNYLDAHLTLFHHLALPAEEVLATVKRVIANVEPFALRAERIAFTGKGVACVIKSPALTGLHKTLQQAFKAVLTAQDKQQLWPHITIQNKTVASQSKVLANELQKTFDPFTCMAAGLQLFYYLDGPWQFIADADFR